LEPRRPSTADARLGFGSAHASQAIILAITAGTISQTYEPLDLGLCSGLSIIAIEHMKFCSERRANSRIIGPPLARLSFHRGLAFSRAMYLDLPIDLWTTARIVPDLSFFATVVLLVPLSCIHNTLLPLHFVATHHSVNLNRCVAASHAREPTDIDYRVFSRTRAASSLAISLRAFFRFPQPRSFGLRAMAHYERHAFSKHVSAAVHCPSFEVFIIATANMVLARPPLSACLSEIRPRFGAL